MLTLFDAVPGSGFAPTQPFQVSADRVILNWTAVVTVAAGIQWYLEFTDENPIDPNTVWNREVAEEDVGSGVTHMPLVVRDFQNFSNGLGLPVGTTGISTNFVRQANFIRAQIKLASGTVTRLKVTVPFGSSPAVPPT